MFARLCTGSLCVASLVLGALALLIAAITVALSQADKSRTPVTGVITESSDDVATKLYIVNKTHIFVVALPDGTRCVSIHGGVSCDFSNNPR